MLEVLILVAAVEATPCAHRVYLKDGKVECADQKPVSCFGQVLYQVGQR